MFVLPTSLRHRMHPDFPVEPFLAAALGMPVGQTPEMREQSHLSPALVVGEIVTRFEICQDTADLLGIILLKNKHKYPNRSYEQNLEYVRQLLESKVSHANPPFTIDEQRWIWDRVQE